MNSSVARWLACAPGGRIELTVANQLTLIDCYAEVVRAYAEMDRIQL